MDKETVSSGNIIDLKVLRRIMKFVAPYRSRFYLVIFLTLTLGIITPLRPWLIQYTIDKHVQHGDYQGMVNIVLIIVALIFVQAIMQYVHTYTRHPLAD